MAVSLPSDIVLDVARAAEPSGLEQARARLRAQAAAAGSAAFSVDAPTGGMRADPVARPRSTKPVPETFVKFEAMVLQTFVQNMLPKDAESVYGAGIAGEMWKSFLSQQMADQMAEAGGIGIAERVLGDYYLANDARVPVAGIDGDPAASAAADARGEMSEAMVSQFQRTIMRTLDEAGAATASTPEE